MTLIAQLASLGGLIPLAADAETEQFDPNRVSPGVGGFLVIALLAVALFFLGLDLVRRLRRAKYRAEIQAKLAVELAERQGAQAAEASGTDDESVDAGGDDDDARDAGDTGDAGPTAPRRENDE